MHRRLLPILDPCTEDFDAMEPRGARRHCARCQTSVHDLSAMTRDEAHRLLVHARGQRICVRYRTEPDGTLRFAPPRARPPARAGLATVLAGLMAACTGSSGSPVAVEGPPVPELGWSEGAGPTIPSDRVPRAGAGEPGTVEGGILGGVVGVTMGAMVVDAVAACDPLPTPVVGPRPVRPRAEPAQTGRASARRAARARRKVQRQQRRQARRIERQQRRRAQRAERDQRRARRAEHEQQPRAQRTEREQRRAAREQRRRARRAARAQRRRARRAERARRREAKRTEQEHRRALRRERRRGRGLARLPR